MKLSQILQSEISSTESVEPNVLMFVDESSIFWVSKDGYYIWLQDHSGISDYVDADHEIESVRPTGKNIEGVGNNGVYWLNADFNSPYHISDFESRINQINSIV